jgi:hypothetical protein
MLIDIIDGNGTTSLVVTSCLFYAAAKVNVYLVAPLDAAM